MRNLVLIVVLSLVAVGRGDSVARFWLSDKDNISSGPKASVINAPANVQKTLYLWGRPATGKKFVNFSLHLVANQTGVDFVDGSYVVHNEHTLGVNRYEFVLDSLAAPALESLETSVSVAGGAVDTLLNWQGFTLFPSATERGVGPNCAESEVGCLLAGDGEPAWLMGALSINPLTIGAVVDLQLQVGDLGINQATVPPGDYDHDGIVATADRTVWTNTFGSTTQLAADGSASAVIDAADYSVWRDNLDALGVVESSALTQVQFGGNPADPIYNASTQRSITLAGDAYDARITVVAPAAIAVTPVPEPAAVFMLLLALAVVQTVSRDAVAERVAPA
jgi:hypothetical protein